MEEPIDPSQNQIHHFIFDEGQLVPSPIDYTNTHVLASKTIPPSVVIYHNSNWISNVCMFCFFGSCMIGLFLIMYYYS